MAIKRKRFCIFSSTSDNVLCFYKTLENAEMGKRLARQMYPDETIELGKATIEIV